MTSLDDGAPGLFSRAAPIYNAVGPRHFSYFAQRLIEFAQIRRGDVVLDVATGTGVVLVAAAERVGAPGHVVGVDVAEPMLEQARAQVVSRGLRNTELYEMDAQQLDFPSQSFDAVLCSFGLSSLPNPARAIEDFGRVLRSSGRLGLVDTFDWYFQHERRWREVEDVLRTFGALTSNEREPHDTGISVRSVLQCAGLADVESIEDAYQLVFQHEEDWWRWSWSHGTRRLLEALPEARMDELKLRLFSALQNCRAADGQIHGTMRATLVRARKPSGGPISVRSGE
jgi:ubiquinone/menaquinone biosynthesis C-methylase UbiE